MKALNIKLATFSFAALLLASCSDNGTDNPVNPITPITNSKLLGISVKSNTDAKELSARVTNYKVTSTKATRASFSDVLETSIQCQQNLQLHLQEKNLKVTLQMLIKLANI